MTSRGELIAGALEAFLQNCPDIDGAAVVSADGLPMASALPPGFEEDRLAAMSAAMLSLGEKATHSLGRGAMRQLFVEGETGFVYLMAAGPSAVLCAVSRPSAKTGLILYEMKEAAGAIARALSPAAAPAYAERRPRAPIPGRRDEPQSEAAATRPSEGVDPDPSPQEREGQRMAAVADLHPVHGQPTSTPR